MVVMGSSSLDMDTSVAGIHVRQQQEIENLTLTTQPFKTLKFFVLALIQYFKQMAKYLLAKGGWLMLSSVMVAAIVILLITIDGPHEKHIVELTNYSRYGLWWIALGVASSIGLGSGLHTFVLYLGPHIALFTIKAVQCGRVDLKSAIYDTIQLKQGPSWLDKDCSAFGDPIFPMSHGVRVPLSSILPQVQIEAVLWGIGTALGELPPYFISRAASVSGSPMKGIEEFDDSSSEDNGIIATHLSGIKRWLLSHSQHLNFFTILLLASQFFSYSAGVNIFTVVVLSIIVFINAELIPGTLQNPRKKMVPNPLFDLAGIMCGQFGISFWTFFLATVIGKAIIKTHIQTGFIIAVCNNQLLELIENELIWILSFVPGLSSVLPNLVAKLDVLKEKYMTPAATLPTNDMAKKWDFSFAAIWNTVVWLMLFNFFVKIVNSTAQSYMRQQLDSKTTNDVSSTNTD